jgi:hypothetical protein
MNPDGSMQLTENCDAMSAIFANYNTKAWLSGSVVLTVDRPDKRECRPESLGNLTLILNSSTTVTMASEWVLPTRPPGLDAIITSGIQGKSGIQGTRGQMVDVTITTINHQIWDSKGEIMTDVVLNPSKSESRTTTARATGGGTKTGGGTASSNTTPSSGLSSGVKAGIGVGVGIGGAIALLAVGLFLLRRRKRKDTSNSLDGLSNVSPYKAELATGPDVEIQPPAELPDQRVVAIPGELAGREYHTTPIELPVHEAALEMPDPKVAE